MTQGKVDVVVGRGLNVMMTGEAVKVFSGEVEVGDGEPVPVVK